MAMDDTSKRGEIDGGREYPARVGIVQGWLRYHPEAARVDKVRSLGFQTNSPPPPPTIHTPTQRRYFGHFWGEHRSYAQVVKKRCAPVVMAWGDAEYGGGGRDGGRGGRDGGWRGRDGGRRPWLRGGRRGGFTSWHREWYPSLDDGRQGAEDQNTGQRVQRQQEIQVQVEDEGRGPMDIGTAGRVFPGAESSKTKSESNPKHLAEFPMQEQRKTKWDVAESSDGSYMKRDTGKGKMVVDPSPQGEKSDSGMPKAGIPTGECIKCGSMDHKISECPRNKPCERCGKYGHEAKMCYTKLLCEYVAPLCATQVEGQSFFLIPDFPSENYACDQDITAIIRVMSGQVSGSQIEREFREICGGTWVWSAIQLDESSFTMRFPNAKTLSDWGHFNLGIRGTNAMISVEPWTPSIGAKGKLQAAWFRVKGIPYNKRNRKTIACIGSLVGATLEIDDRTLSRIDFVRVRIACKNLEKVPAVVEGVILPFVYDFFFEREIEVEEKEQGLSMKVVDTNGSDHFGGKKPFGKEMGGSSFAGWQNKGLGSESAPSKSRGYTGQRSNTVAEIKTKEKTQQKGGSVQQERISEVDNPVWDPDEDDLLSEEENDNKTKSLEQQHTISKCLVSQSLVVKQPVDGDEKICYFKQETRARKGEKVLVTEEQKIPESRRSDRVQEKMMNKILKSEGINVKKRSYEGLYPDDMQKKVKNGADCLMEVALKVMRGMKGYILLPSPGKKEDRNHSDVEQKKLTRAPFDEE